MKMLFRVVCMYTTDRENYHRMVVAYIGVYRSERSPISTFSAVFGSTVRMYLDIIR